MLTFNIQSRRTDNFYCGHEPSDGRLSCWSNEADALVLSIEQARALVAAWQGSAMKIMVSAKEGIMDAQDYSRELFCTAGGDWHEWPHRQRLAAMVKCGHEPVGSKCIYCGARWQPGASGYWYDSVTGRELCEELKTNDDKN